MNLGLKCNRCEGEIRPLRRPPQTLREYTLRVFQCQRCRKKVAVAWFVVGQAKAKWLERIYEEHNDEGL